MPLETATFDLIADQIHFYTLSDTRQMRFSRNTKMVRYVAYKCCGGQFLRFWSGFNNTCTDTKQYHPQDSSIILALPGEDVICKFNPYESTIPKQLKPGFFHQLTAMYIKCHGVDKTYVLKFDGRQIRAGFEGDEGDIDYGD